MSTAAMTVYRSISGSIVCVQVGRNWERYVDAKADVRKPGMSFIETVRSGQVIHRETVANAVAPERILDLAKGLAP